MVLLIDPSALEKSPVNEMVVIGWLCEDAVADGTNAAGSGDDILSASVSMSVPNADSVHILDNHADSRVSEMVAGDVAEKRNSLLYLQYS